MQPGDISTLPISTLDISTLHNVMNNGYGCIWTRVRVLSVLTAGDPGLVRVRLASTSHQRRPGVLPASVPPRPPRRAQRSSSGESLDSGVRRRSRRRRGGARTSRAVTSKIQADLGSYERVYDVLVSPCCCCPPCGAGGPGGAQSAVCSSI